VQAEPFRTADVLANLRHIRDMQVDQVGDSLDPVLVLGSRFLPQVDFSLNSARPHFGVLAEREAIGEVVALTANLHAPLAGSQLVDGCHGWSLFRARWVHTQRYKIRKLTDILAYKRRTCARFKALKIREKA